MGKRDAGTGELNYIVHGAGAIGSVIAARLSQAGRRVALVARGEHLAALVRGGLVMRGLTEGVFDLPAAKSAGELGGAGGIEADIEVDADTVVILAMKTQDMFDAVEAHEDLYKDLPIFCFQNGVSNEEWLAQRGFRTYGVMVRIGARIEEPGVVAHTGARHAQVGCWPSGVDELAQAVSDDLSAGGLHSSVHSNIAAAKWGKLVINLANAFLALTDTSVQAAYGDGSVRRFIADVEQEAAAVLSAAGIEVEIEGSSDLAARIERLRGNVEARPAERRASPAEEMNESYPSTWQDLKAGRKRVEVRYFNGRIVELGRQHGIAVPLNQVLLALCEDAAARQLGPGTETEASIRQAATNLGSARTRGSCPRSCLE